jgi:hypothetical protein
MHGYWSIITINPNEKNSMKRKENKNQLGVDKGLIAMFLKMTVEKE